MTDYSNLPYKTIRLSKEAFDKINKDEKMTEEIINSDGSRNWEANILLDNIKRLEQENEKLKKEVKQIGSDFIKKGDYARELEQENKTLYEEKNCLHKIIDRLLENAGYSKDIASAEDFEDVYEDMQIKRNELIELEQENKELKIYIESNKQQVEEVEMLVMDNNRLQQDAENLKDVIYYDVEKYRSALEEIRNSVINYLPKENYKFARSFNPEKFELLENILNKINEVLNDN